MNLNALSKEELVTMIETLCDEKEIEAYFVNNIEKMKLKNKKKEIDELFFPLFGIPYISLPEVDSMIQEFEKECSSILSKIEIEFFYVESIVEFTRTFGMMGNEFYEKLIVVFKEVIHKIKEQELTTYEDRIEYVLNCMQYMNPNIYQRMKECM